MTPENNLNIPVGFCQCGCGKATAIPVKSNTRDGYIKGVPRLFVQGHGQRIYRLPPRFDVLDGNDVALLSLPHDLWAIIDKLDLPSVVNYDWYPRWNNQSRTFYVQYGHWEDCDGVRRKRTVQLHRLLMQATANIKIDHINGNGLDNRRSMNLRFATDAQNGSNRHRLDPNNTSGRTGVHWHTRNHKWTANIGYADRLIHLGSFETFEEAVRAREEAEIHYHGEFKRQSV